MMVTEYPVALSGVVGSTAYGLARAGSDVDRLGIYVADTRHLVGLHPYTPTVHSAGPDQPEDHTFHELGKFVRLAGVCNPTVLELLFLPDDLVEVCTAEGTLLRENASAFLSERAVRSAHAGYAHAQAKKLASRGDGSFSSSTRARTAKHARHCFRLMRNARMLLTTGTLDLRVENPEFYFAFDTMATDRILELFAAEYEQVSTLASVLPAETDWARLEELTLAVRDAHYGFTPPPNAATVQVSPLGTAASSR